MIRSIEHVAIAAKDIPGLARWYCDTLGFRVVVDGGATGMWFVGPPEGEAIVEIVRATDAPRLDRHQNDAGWSHLAFTVTDFEAVHKVLLAKGVEFVGQPRALDGGGWIGFFRDAEGNVLQLVQRAAPLR